MTRIAELQDRLRRLAKRREGEGIYTDAAICEEAAEALSRTGAVKVKALEWRYFDNGDAFAHTHVRLSYAAHTNGDWRWRDGPLNKTGGDIETAKAAAQADFERRLSHHIETAGPEGQQPVDQDLRDAAKAMGAALAREIPLVGATTRPAEQAVTDEMVGAAEEVFFKTDDHGEPSYDMRAALTAAMEARHD